MTFEMYERLLEANLDDLVGRLKQKRYRAKLVRRKHIPKGNGKTRPLGIPVLEDKLIQLAVSKILEAIYEEDFLDCSWGYRPGRGAQDASRKLSDELYRGNYGWVYEADIRSFFNNINHDWMLRMLKERVDDGAFLNLIEKWLKAGVLEEDGKVVHPVTGTPQGGIVSPVLANIYLNYALDLWFEKGFQRMCSGKTMLIRYADDFVCAFSNRDDAQRFEQELSNRLEKFGLKTAPEKTRILRFSRYIAEPNDAFEFLGFEYRWVRRRTGKMGVRRRTSPERLRASIKSFDEWIKTYKYCRINTIMESLSRKFNGYWNYYGVRGNFDSLSKFYYVCRRILFKRLNRRSQRRSYTWEAFEKMLKHFCVPLPRIVEKPRNQLFFQF